MSTFIHETALIHGNVFIGEDVYIGPYCVIGEPAEHHHTQSNDNAVIIGDGVTLREHVVVQRGLDNGCGTTIGAECYIMHGAHIAHDCTVEKSVTLSPYVVLGGHSTVMYGATLGIQSALHQWVTVGAYAMLGMGSMAIHDIPCGMIAMGSPARITGPNTVGLDRAGNPALVDHLMEYENARSRKEAKPA
jgi:UDP-N-acetylglucosamine acyltransferase